MPAKSFLDTNVLVYTFDATAPRKRERAREIVAVALQSGRACLSYQVAQEFLNVATTKFATPMDPAECRDYLRSVLMPLCRIWPDEDLYVHALSIQAVYRYGWYDSLILASAKRAGCAELLTEDMQADQVVEGVRIVDPFR